MPSDLFFLSARRLTEYGNSTPSYRDAVEMTFSACRSENHNLNLDRFLGAGHFSTA